MISLKPLSLRHLPLLTSAIFVFFSPFVLANDAEIQIPSVNYSGQARKEDDDKCSLCAAGQTQQLQKLLKQYQEIAAGGGWPEWDSGKELHAGMTDSRVPTLRLTLSIMGDYSGKYSATTASDRYDDTLVEAVKRFQERHGLNVTGKLTKATQEALDIPVEKRISQIMNTLNRMHDETASYGPKYILVNLPAFTLYAVNNQQVATSMRVIVGSRQNHTPLFDNAINAVIFNPPWNVPARIARNEMIPKLRKNPSYFINAGFVVTQDGQEVDPMTVDTSSGGFSFRQRSGNGNALGKIKFNIPDNDDIYLHSTSSPKLFTQEDRALSHGCVRLEKPRELAYFVLGGETGWDTDRIDSNYDSNTQRSVKVSTVPVHLVYWTAMVDSNGAAHFYHDVYNKDKNNAVTAERDDNQEMVVAAK
jgi:murein L,D-transpeptidase YcbB/YkuD